MELTFLGAGTPTPTPERFGTSQVLRIGDECLLFDCGPATTYKMVKAGISPTAIHHLFFTHHHFDHSADFPCFLLTRWDQGADRIPDLKVVGPAPTVEFTRRVLDADCGAFAFDWKARVGAPQSQRVFVNRGGELPRRPPSVDVSDIRPGFVLEQPHWRLTAAHASHVQPYLESLAYRVDTDEGSVVFTGDTEPCSEVIDLARGADIIVAMCWDVQARMANLQEDSGQAGPRTAGLMASEAQVGRLVLTHMGPYISSASGLDEGLAEAAETFDGEVIVARELHTVDC